MTKFKTQTVDGSTKVRTQLSVILGIAFLLLCFTAPISAQQKTAINWRVKRILVHKQFGAELQELAMWCRKNGAGKQLITDTLSLIHI